jgi:hypothetical protein
VGAEVADQAPQKRRLLSAVVKVSSIFSLFNLGYDCTVCNGLFVETLKLSRCLS